MFKTKLETKMGGEIEMTDHAGFNKCLFDEFFTYELKTTRCDDSQDEINKEVNLLFETIWP